VSGHVGAVPVFRQKLADQGEKRGGAEGLRVQKPRPDITKKGVAQASLSL
jgi:hypothetical protein